MTTACKLALSICKAPTVTRNSVHIVIQGGSVVEAYADTNVDVIVYDLDTQDPDMLAEVQASVAQLAKHNHEIEIL